MPMSVSRHLPALLCSLSFGQQFEVATIKPVAPQSAERMTSGCNTNDPGRIVCKNEALSALLGWAYDLKRSQIAGADSLDSAKFDITATLPKGASRQQLRAMLQNLLADRFKVAAHREKKDLPIYALVNGKNGAKMKEFRSGTPEEDKISMGGPMGDDGCTRLTSPQNRPIRMLSMQNGNACYMMVGQTMTALADALGSILDRPVVDLTGLEGKYVFTLSFEASSAGKGMELVTGAQPVASANRAADIFSAVREQLGLELASRKGPVDVLVIDHIGKGPTEN